MEYVAGLPGRLMYTSMVSHSTSNETLVDCRSARETPLGSLSYSRVGIAAEVLLRLTPRSVKTLRYEYKQQELTSVYGFHEAALPYSPEII